MIIVEGSKQQRERFARAVKRITELEAENQKLREQRDAANAVIQTLNRIIAGDVG